MVASSLGPRASPRLAGYGASKAGARPAHTHARAGVGRSRRARERGLPGLRRDGHDREMLAVERLRAEVLGSTPMGRLGTLAEVVAPTLFLLSDEASYVTGAALAVDGGMAS